jgi:hypothetical protein
VKVPMPSLTLTIVRISAFLRVHPVLFAALVTGLPASIHLWQPRAVSIGRIAIPLLFFVMWAWMVVGLFLPLIGTLEGIGQRR